MADRVEPFRSLNAMALLRAVSKLLGIPGVTGVPNTDHPALLPWLSLGTLARRRAKFGFNFGDTGCHTHYLATQTLPFRAKVSFTVSLATGLEPCAESLDLPTQDIRTNQVLLPCQFHLAGR